MIKVLEPARGPDVDLSDGLRRGEPRAFEALPERRVERSFESPFERQYERHWGAVFGVLYRLMGTREEAEDLAQEAFLKLYQRGPVGDGEANVGGWLYRVATNLGYNELRGHRRRVAREERVAASEFTTEDGPLATVVAAEERAAVRAVLATLPERQQACLVLRYGGLAYAEVAEALGVAPGSVGTLLARAEREFRKRYEAQQGGL
jgi:RNA polymerase sigma-70 factor, ECF subfamily